MKLNNKLDNNNVILSIWQVWFQQPWASRCSDKTGAAVPCPGTSPWDPWN